MAANGICAGDFQRIEETLGWHELTALRKYWSKVPPLNVLMAEVHMDEDKKPSRAGKGKPASPKTVAAVWDKLKRTESKGPG